MSLFRKLIYGMIRYTMEVKFWIIKKMWGKRVVDFAVKKKKVVELTEELK